VGNESVDRRSNHYDYDLFVIRAGSAGVRAAGSPQIWVPAWP
jgi:hypothetical protein